MTGGRGSVSVILGFETYSMTNQKSGTVVSGCGTGIGIGCSAEFIWVTLSRMN